MDNHLSHSGISVEQIMHRLPSELLNKFLELLRRVIQKCQTTSANVDRIATSYRVFERFDRAIKMGWGRAEVSEVMAIMWGMYVMAKQVVGRELGIQEEVALIERGV